MANILQEEDIRNVSAGGGQSSGVAQYQTVEKFAPAVYGHLEQIYNKLLAQARTIGRASDGPDLASFEAFQAWFHSPNSSALAPPIEHDLSHPLSNYYISSSHNTYILHGNQLTGHASPDAYAYVLRRGCRCVELDVYDPDEDASLSDIDDDVSEGSLSSTHRSSVGMLKQKLLHRKHSPSNPSTSPPVQGMSNLTVDAGTMPPLTRTVSNAERVHLLRTEPTVYHGHTKVNRIAFRQVCQAIRESAFQTSTLPVIMSLEVHANPMQQQLMVDILKQELAGYLVDLENETVKFLPSPDALRNKILIKVKNSTGGQAAESDALDPVETNATLATTTTHSSEESATYATTKPKKLSKIIDALARLGQYTHAYSFKHFDQPEASYPTHVFSLSESTVEQIHEDFQHGLKMFEHNREYLLRVYPMAVAIGSDNYDPTFSWRQGAQMVALNWQKLDLGMMLNEGMFAGEEGYVLKPEGFRSSTISTETRPQRHLLNLNVRLIAAQNLPLSPEKGAAYAEAMRPYVRLQLHVDNHGPPGTKKRVGEDAKASRFSKYRLHQSKSSEPSATQGDEDDEDDDEGAGKLKRRSKSSKTCSPDFANVQFAWNNVPDVVEQLSFLRLKVHDDRPFAKDPLVAWACIRLDRLKTGYRFVHLLDGRGDPCKGVLLVKIEKGLLPHD